MTADERRGDRSAQNAGALAAAIARLGIRCALEVRGGLALLVPTLDPAVDELVSRCLHPKPDNRPNDCDEFLAVLTNYRQRSGQ